MSNRISKPNGRPPVMTETVIKKLEEAYAMDCTDIEACLHADIAPSTLYGYQVENPSFLERKRALKSRPFLKARKSMMQGLDSDDYDFALKYMERKKKDEFAPAPANNVQNNILLPTADIEKRIQILRESGIEIEMQADLIEYPKNENIHRD